MTLETLNLTKSFGGLCAVDGVVSFTASTGELTCITGPNGAGKTTVFNLLTGFYAPDAGAGAAGWPRHNRAVTGGAGARGRDAHVSEHTPAGRTECA